MGTAVVMQRDTNTCDGLALLRFQGSCYHFIHSKFSVVYVSSDMIC